MKCLDCDCEKFELKKVRFNPEIKGEEVEVIVPSFVCKKCQTPLMDGEQMNVLRRSAADKYRKQHHLLTSEEIIKYRALLGMSQAAFANYLKVGEASIKRWETYFVQDVVQDDHIRLKCDEAYAELNALEVHRKTHSSDIYRGNSNITKSSLSPKVQKTTQHLLKDQIFQKMLNHLKINFNCHTFILYGSRARGIDITDSSDYDIIAIRRAGENIREACEFEGSFIDASIYSESTLEKIDSSFLRVKDGLIIEQKKDVATKLLQKVDEIFKTGPIPTPEWEHNLISSWLQKMYQRSTLKDIEGNYRRHWLLFDCLESYFKLRNLWYLGPKESFNWLKMHDGKVYHAFRKALSVDAQEIHIQKLIKLIAMKL